MIVMILPAYLWSSNVVPGEHHFTQLFVWGRTEGRQAHHHQGLVSAVDVVTERLK